MQARSASPSQVRSAASPSASPSGPPHAAPGRRCVWIGLAALAACALMAAWYLLPLADWMSAFGAWARGWGAAGVAIVCAAYVLGTLACVPGWPLTLLVAVAYGWWAIPIALGGGMTAALLAFLIGRTIARRPIERVIARHPKLKAIDGVAHDESFKTILLARLTPVTPFAMENYAFGVTGVTLPGYLAATFVGIVPGTILNVWVGVLGRTAAGGEASAANWAFLGIGFAATVVLVVWMTHAVKRRMKGPDGAPEPRSKSRPQERL
ncbi:TVP38/TMEM64 family protein [Propylenella binzhouense]|nr:TVP38/TMEM64 family protein [Propylenella binzhouense]